MALTATYDPGLSRVRLAATVLGTATYAVFQRSVDLVNWTTIRGGGAVNVSAASANLDDYEFPAGVFTAYRVLAYDATDTLVASSLASTTADLADVWVKVVARPFMNRQVVASVNFAETRTARAGLFPVAGRSFPVAVSDVRGSRQFDLQIRTETAVEFRDLDLVLASGEPIFLHVPSTNTRISTGYYHVGDTTAEPTGRTLDQRILTLQMTEIAAPGPDIVGAASTWQTVLTAYPTWSDVVTAHTTWADVLELIGSPTEVIVP